MAKSAIASDRHVFRSAWIPVAAVPAAAALVVPSFLDSFEGPKRLAWCVTASAMAVCLSLREKAFSRRHGGALVDPASAAGIGSSSAVAFFGCCLLAWMFFRSLAAASFWAFAGPLSAWILPLLLCLLAIRFRMQMGGSSPGDGATRAVLLCRSVVFTALAEASLALLQRFGTDPLFGSATGEIGYAPGRMIGTVGYQNQVAEWLGVAICCVPAAFGRRSVRFADSAFLGFAVLLSANRGALFGMAAAGAFVVVSDLRMARSGGPGRWNPARRPVVLPQGRSPVRLLHAVILSLAVAAAAVAISPELRGRLCEIAAPVRMQAVQSRLWSARVALSIWKDHPVFGGGAGSFAREGIERMGELLPARKEHECLRSIAWARETHCDPLQFAAEFGVVGLALAILFAVFILRGLPRNETGRSVAAAAVFLTAASLFSFSWQTTLAAPVVGLLAGMALGEKPSGAAPGPAAMFGLGKAWRLGSVTVSAACWFVVAVTAAADFSAEMHLCRRSGDELRPQGYPWRAPAFVHGRYLEKLAADALACGDARFAAEAGRKAVDEWSSPSTLAVRASALEASGRRKEALDAWRRLRRSGFLHDVALKSESASAEALGRIAEAAESEAERFRLWPRSFSDGELFRLCALSLLSGNAARAETLSRTFLRRCERLGETDRRWTPAWENLRGGALLALGRREKARACFESALRRDPALQSARRNLDAMLCQDEDHRPNGN